MIYFYNLVGDWRFTMLKLSFGFVLLVAQLTAPGNNLPQILSANFKAAAPVKAGLKANVTVSFNVLKGYAINRTPPISLKLNPAPGLHLDKTDFTTPSADPKSKDEYYAELPTLKIPVTAA